MEKQRKDEQEREILLKAAKVANLMIEECGGQRSGMFFFVTNVLMCQILRVGPDKKTLSRLGLSRKPRRYVSVTTHKSSSSGKNISV